MACREVLRRLTPISTGSAMPADMASASSRDSRRQPSSFVFRMMKATIVSYRRKVTALTLREAISWSRWLRALWLIPSFPLRRMVMM